MKTKKIITNICLIFFSALLFSGCGSKKTTTIAPTPTPRLIELSPDQRPYISLIPRADGHQLKMIISKIPNNIDQIEYELIYTAKDQNNEIEKGLGDTLKLSGITIERDLLLGTESCTNGCKYKYDEGVTGGTLSITLITKDSQVTTFQSQFALRSSTDLKKGKLDLSTENFSITATPSTKDEFFVLLKNYGIPSGSNAKNAYSVFSSKSGKGAVTSISPDSISKSDKNQINGDYLEL